ncbi:MAG TPA: response regulator [Pyrinomonadaceae bacterium]|nr:response regulator [Pyrinomonadaceae bacterium]
MHPAHLKVPLEFARLLNAQVFNTGAGKVVEAADALEAWLTLLVAETEPLSESRTLSLLDQISELEVALYDHKAKELIPAVDVADFVDESFEVLRANTNVPAAHAPGGAKPNGDIEADSELLEVFNEEAASLLRSFKSNLEILSARPKDRDALWEIKKSAHTFKGAAGVVGLRKLSDLAHRVEDLLEQISEKNADLNVHIVGLLLNAAECLESFARDESSAEIDAKIESLYQEFAKALGEIGQPDRGPEISPAASTSAAGAPKRRASDAFAAPRKNNSIVRVSLDRLDELALKMRELFGSRSAFEQRLADLEQQLDESHNNTLRLLAAYGKSEWLHAESASAGSDGFTADRKAAAYELAEAVKDASLINSAFDNVRTNLEAIYDVQCSTIDEVKERLLRLRHVEFGSISNRLQRTVRVTCDEEEKRAEVIIENGSLEVDTQLIDALIEPLLHLLKNAVVHGIENPETRRILGKPEAGKITIRISNKGEHTVLSVTDDGRGIAFVPLLEKAVVSNLISRAEAEQMTSRKICELIFLPGLTTAKKLNLNAGRGVGMSIVRDSIAAAGGTISIETWPQKGTTFTVRIPRPFANEAPAPSRASASLAPGPGKIKVMIVDDSPSVRLATSRVVEKAGWTVETARNGIDALEKLKLLPLPNVILSDIEMPRMGGFELFGALREDQSLKNIPVIFISSRTTDADRQQAAAAGVAAYLAKPFDPVELLELINNLTLATEFAGKE